ncbi:MAG: hypothetical protein WBA98_08260 [Gordonia sp. (in: high G+C Gram-positive bacteria)]|uniref:hypothetical protein n=1 Tax=Gordonia sp. (in: high G+C Gram-positive bacteria) TaxID=84139 RepID=UPI003C707286
MSDPAIEAADRAWDERGFDASAADIAREALAPIRELHFQSTRLPSRLYRHCVTCRTPWPCPTARFCYTTEELQ